MRERIHVLDDLSDARARKARAQVKVASEQRAVEAWTAREKELRHELDVIEGRANERQPWWTK